jgi:hypothetical protein
MREKNAARIVAWHRDAAFCGGDWRAVLRGARIGSFAPLHFHPLRKMWKGWVQPQLLGLAARP